MPDIRCPMCSKANAAEAEVCLSCGARLKPLVLDPASEAAAADAPRETPGEIEEHEEQPPDLVERLRSQVKPPADPEAPDSEKEGRLPDWLDRLRPPGRRRKPEEVEEAADPDEEPRQENWLDRLRKVQTSADAMEEQDDPPDDGGLAKAVIPDWLHVSREEDDAIEGTEEEPEEDQVELGERLAIHAPEPPETEELVDEEDDIPAEPAAESLVLEEPPEEAAEIPADSEAEPAYTPALIMDDDVAEDEPKDIDLEAIQVPEWVGDDRPSEAPTLKDEVSEESGIARAVLPGWLEAMRPVETFRTLEEDEDEEAKPVETIGPLAGLSDVLIAEPVVAMPRIPGVTSPSITITQQDDDQAQILRRLVEAERQDIAPSGPRPRPLPILRWIVSLLLVIAVIVPLVLSDSIFPAPRWVPQDLETLRNLVEDLPRDRPALVVADYDPGYSAELEAVGSSLLDHLLQRGIPLVTLSTRATGPALAQRLIDNVTAWQAVEAGESYLHLGYLAGGPTAVQLFASNPRYGGLAGFMLPEERDWSTPWEAPILRDVEHLEDFGVVVVITAGTETARTWAEQAAPQTGETAFIMVLSAGAEPLVRPYYAGADPQVDAIFTGLPSAKANELLSGRSGNASMLWDAFGAGGWTATGVLVVGGIVGVITSLLRRGPKEDADV